MKKKIRERPITRTEQNDGGPYWHWVKMKCPSDDAGLLLEPATANPDLLSEDTSIWAKRETSTDYRIKKKKLKQALDNALSQLTETDKEIVTLMSQKFHTIRELAEILGVSKGFIQHRLDKIRRLSVQSL